MSRSFKISLFLLALLAAAILVQNRRQHRIEPPPPKPLLAFKFEDVGSFQINNFISGYLFERKGESWQIRRVKNDMARSVEAKDKTFTMETDAQGRPANNLAVVKAVLPVFNIVLHEPVATANSDQKLFEINEYSLHIIFYDRQGKELDRISVGKEGQDLFTSYVKKRGSTDIYLVSENLRALLWRNYEEW
jgi:hypothetical protein